jgi:hypothetical protein
METPEDEMLLSFKRALCQYPAETTTQPLIGPVLEADVLPLQSTRVAALEEADLVDGSFSACGRYMWKQARNVLVLFQRNAQRYDVVDVCEFASSVEILCVAECTHGGTQGGALRLLLSTVSMHDGNQLLLYSPRAHSKAHSVLVDGSVMCMVSLSVPVGSEVLLDCPADAVIVIGAMDDGPLCSVMVSSAGVSPVTELLHPRSAVTCLSNIQFATASHSSLHDVYCTGHENGSFSLCSAMQSKALYALDAGDLPVMDISAYVLGEFLYVWVLRGNDAVDGFAPAQDDGELYSASVYVFSSSFALVASHENVIWHSDPWVSSRCYQVQDNTKSQAESGPGRVVCLFAAHPRPALDSDQVPTEVPDFFIAEIYYNPEAEGKRGSESKSETTRFVHLVTPFKSITGAAPVVFDASLVQESIVDTYHSLVPSSLQPSVSRARSICFSLRCMYEDCVSVWSYSSVQRACLDVFVSFSPYAVFPGSLPSIEHRASNSALAYCRMVGLAAPPVDNVSDWASYEDDSDDQQQQHSGGNSFERDVKQDLLDHARCHSCIALCDMAVDHGVASAVVHAVNEFGNVALGPLHAWCKAQVEQVAESKFTNVRDVQRHLRRLSGLQRVLRAIETKSPSQGRAEVYAHLMVANGMPLRLLARQTEQQCLDLIQKLSLYAWTGVHSNMLVASAASTPEMFRALVDKYRLVRQDRAALVAGQCERDNKPIQFFGVSLNELMIDGLMRVGRCQVDGGAAVSGSFAQGHYPCGSLDSVIHVAATCNQPVTRSNSTELSDGVISCWRGTRLLVMCYFLIDVEQLHGSNLVAPFCLRFQVSASALSFVRLCWMLDHNQCTGNWTRVYELVRASVPFLAEQQALLGHMFDLQWMVLRSLFVHKRTFELVNITNMLPGMRRCLDLSEQGRDDLYAPQESSADRAVGPLDAHVVVCAMLEQGMYADAMLFIRSRVTLIDEQRDQDDAYMHLYSFPYQHGFAEIPMHYHLMHVLCFWFFQRDLVKHLFALPLSELEGDFVVHFLSAEPEQSSKVVLQLEAGKKMKRVDLLILFHLQRNQMREAITAYHKHRPAQIPFALVQSANSVIKMTVSEQELAAASETMSVQATLIARQAQIWTAWQEWSAEYDFDAKKMADAMKPFLGQSVMMSGMGRSTLLSMPAPAQQQRPSVGPSSSSPAAPAAVSRSAWSSPAAASPQKQMQQRRAPLDSFSDTRAATNFWSPSKKDGKSAVGAALDVSAVGTPRVHAQAPTPTATQPAREHKRTPAKKTAAVVSTTPRSARHSQSLRRKLRSTLAAASMSQSGAAQETTMDYEMDMPEPIYEVEQAVVSPRAGKRKRSAREKKEKAASTTPSSSATAMDLESSRALFAPPTTKPAMPVAAAVSLPVSRMRVAAEDEQQLEYEQSPPRALRSSARTKSAVARKKKKRASPAKKKVAANKKAQAMDDSGEEEEAPKSRVYGLRSGVKRPTRSVLEKTSHLRYKNTPTRTKSPGRRRSGRSPSPAARGGNTRSSSPKATPVRRSTRRRELKSQSQEEEEETSVPATPVAAVPVPIPAVSTSKRLRRRQLATPRRSARLAKS